MSISWIDPCRCSSATRSGSTSIDADGTVRAHGVGQLVRLAARDAGAVRARRVTRAELAQAIVDGPGPVRVAGAGHSFSAGAVTDGHAALARRASTACSTPTGDRPRPRRGRHPPERALARAARARAGDAEPRRHRRPVARGRARRPARTAPARGSRTCPARSRRRADARRRQRAHDRRRRRAARRARLARRARRDRRGHAALRARVPAASHLDQPEPLERRARRAAGARRRARPLRVLDLPARRRRAHAHATTAPRTRRTAPGRAALVRRATS